MALKLKQLQKASNNPWSFVLSDENNPYEITDKFDTGCYALNAFCCDGDIFGGIPFGKREAFSGESSTAKSFFGAHILKSFLDIYDDAMVILFETEGSSIKQQAEEIGIDMDRVIIEPVSIVEETHKLFLKYIDKLEADYFKTKERTKVLFVIDSLGMLSSKKEVDDKRADKDVSDMTRAKAIKSMYRAISLKLSLLGTSLITINHTYANTGGYGDSQIESGGSGFAYSGDVRFFLQKKQKKTGTIQTGIIITAKIKKSRWIKENQKIEINLDFEKGLNRNSHLIEWANILGMLEADETTVKYNGEEYPREVFETKFTEYFGVDNMKIFAEKVKGMLGFGAGDGDVNNMSVDKLVAYGVQFGFISDTPRMIILPDGEKIKKKELRANPDIIPEDLINKIKEKIESEKEDS